MPNAGSRGTDNLYCSRLGGHQGEFTGVEGGEIEEGDQAVPFQ